MTATVDETTPLTPGLHNHLWHKNNVTNNSLEKGPAPQRSFRSKFLESVIIIAAYNTQGALSALTGPTLIALQLLTDSTTEAISRVITGDFTGQLLSCAVVAFVLARLSYNLLLFVSLALMAAMTAVIPWCPNVPSMIGVFAVRGFSSGFVGIGLNAAVVWIWGLKNGPYMQALHLSFSIGALCSPLIVKPFLAMPSTDGTDWLNGTYNDSRNMVEYSDTSVTLQNGEINNSRIYIPYTLFAVWACFCAMMFFIRFVILKQFFATRPMGQEQTTPPSREFRPKWFYVIRIGATAYSLLISMVLVGFSGFLSLFVVQYLKWSAADGALLTTVFWAALSTGRGITVLGIHLWSPSIIMIFGSVISSIFFVVLSVVNPLNNSVVWASVALIGLGIGPLTACGFSWYAQNVSMVTSLMAAVLVGSSALGSAISPLILGPLFNYVSPLWFCYLLGGVHVVSLVLLTLICITSRILNNGHHTYVKTTGKLFEYEAVISEDITTTRQ